MTPGRMEAFSDGVIAILITVMVLGLRTPDGTSWSSLRAVWPVLLSYVLSFVYLGIYWNNHHHLLKATRRVNGAILWANLHLLFWLSLVPWTTSWFGEKDFATVPSAVYGIVLLAAAVAFYILQQAIIRDQGTSSVLARAVGRDRKGKLSPVFYAVGVGLAFVQHWLAFAVFTGIALMWLIPDRRVSSVLAATSAV